MAQANILLIDDDGEALLSLSRALRAADIAAAVHAAGRADQALNLFQQKNPESVVLDLCLEERRGVESGFQLLSELLELDRTVRIIVLTGHGSVEHGVRALRCGAASFLEKPADIPHLVALLQDGISQSQLRRAVEKLKAEGAEDRLSEIVIGESPAAEELRKHIRFASQTNQAIFVSGETGTGKGLCARMIHEQSIRQAREFVRYQPNFGAADLVSSDLFGHVRGAFTGAAEDRSGLIAAAQGGTLFLDEIDELPPETQVTLLGVLQDKRYRKVGASREEQSDFRLITASNRNVDECLEKGKIRADFYHRVAHLRIALPPLRERKGDIQALVAHQLRSLRRREALGVMHASAAALQALEAYQWPGNIRELEAAIEGAAYRAQYAGRSVFDECDLSLGHAASTATTQSFNARVEEFKVRLIREELARCGNNQVLAAKALGIDRGTLRRMLKN